MVKLKYFRFLLVIIFLLFGACSINNDKNTLEIEDNKNIAELNNSKYKSVVFAGGCFWCIEATFEKINGVSHAISGFSGGEEIDPLYNEVASGKTGHVEAVKVFYNPKIINYEKLLEVFWGDINPTDDGGQFVDRGFQYTTAIFYNNEEEKKLAIKSKEILEKSGKYGNNKIVTRIIPLKKFYEAEEYHQDYHTKNPIRYNYYRKGSGRDDYLNSLK